MLLRGVGSKHNGSCAGGWSGGCTGGVGGGAGGGEGDGTEVVTVMSGYRTSVLKCRTQSVQFPAVRVNVNIMLRSTKEPRPSGKGCSMQTSPGDQ